MNRRTLLWGVLGLWILAMVWSGLAVLGEPTGDGFTRGMNRLTGFLSAQLVGAILAFVAWILSARFSKRSAERWLGRIPGWWVVALLVLIAGSIAVAFLTDPPPPPPAPNLPTTQAPDALPVE